MEITLDQAIEKIKQLESENANLSLNLKLLSQKIDLLIKRIFGKRSEKIDPGQLLLDLGIPPCELIIDKPENDPTDPPKRKKRKSKSREEKLPDNLPVEEIIITPDEVKDNPDDYVCIGEETREELDIEPQRFIRRVIRRLKFKKKDDKSMPPIISPAPAQVIEKSYATPGLLSLIVINKYVNHLPLYRQSQMFKREGIDLSRQTMSEWMWKVSDWLGLLYDRLRDELITHEYLQVDESPVKYLDPGSGKCGQGYLWLYNVPTEGVLYQWHPSRAARCLDSVLDDFEGIIQSDGYSAYGAYEKERRKKIKAKKTDKEIKLAACWAHARRKFLEAMEESPVFNGWILRQIQLLYHIETELREKQHSSVLRQRTRCSSSQMVLDRINKALKKKMYQHLPQLLTGKAIAYTLNLWEELNVYVVNGQLEIDNNLVENAVRPMAIGRKNWLFFGSETAGQTSAVIYTFVENCKRLGINPYEYFKDVLSRLPTMSNKDIGQLLPANWLKARTSKAA